MCGFKSIDSPIVSQPRMTARHVPCFDPDAHVWLGPKFLYFIDICHSVTENAGFSPPVVSFTYDMMTDSGWNGLPYFQTMCSQVDVKLRFPPATTE